MNDTPQGMLRTLATRAVIAAVPAAMAGDLATYVEAFTGAGSEP